MSLTILPLGVNGYIPTHGRHTSSILVADPPTAILLDAGTGVARFVDEAVREILEDCRELHILLSHYHLDHTIGLFFLPELWSRWPVRTYAPRSIEGEHDPKAILRRMLQPPLSSDFEPPPIEKYLDIHEIGPGSMDIGRLKIVIREQTHPGGSLGFRINDELVYATDTIPDGDTVSFSKGVAFLLHDCYLGQDEAGAGEMSAHSSLRRAAEIAADARATRLVPVHLHPRWTRGFLDSLIEETSDWRPPILWPIEGRKLDLP